MKTCILSALHGTLIGHPWHRLTFADMSDYALCGRRGTLECTSRQVALADIRGGAIRSTESLQLEKKCNCELRHHPVSHRYQESSSPSRCVVDAQQCGSDRTSKKTCCPDHDGSGTGILLGCGMKRGSHSWRPATTCSGWSLLWTPIPRVYRARARNALSQMVSAENIGGAAWNTLSCFGSTIYIHDTCDPMSYICIVAPHELLQVTRSPLEGDG